MTVPISNSQSSSQRNYENENPNPSCFGAIRTRVASAIRRVFCIGNRDSAVQETQLQTAASQTVNCMTMTNKKVTYSNPPALADAPPPYSKEDSAICEKQVFNHLTENSAAQIKGQGCYFDLGTANGPFYNIMNWYPYTGFFPEQIQTYTDNLFGELKDAGVDTFYFAFAQLGDLDTLVSGTKGTLAQDVFSQNVNDPNFVVGTGPNQGQTLLQCFVKAAHDRGIKVCVSFGGLFATGDINKILNTSSDTPTGQAQKLADYVNSNGIDQLDFDFEAGAQLFETNTKENTLTFFETLHTALKQNGKIMSLTSLGDVNSNPRGAFKPFYFDDQGNSVINKYFDRVNLMLYSDTNYYLDVNNPNATWNLNDWIDVVGKDNSSMISIGFDDGVKYEDPTAKGPGGKSYNLDSQSRGKSAAMIYLQLLQDLDAMQYPTNLAECFWWPDEQQYSTRYDIAEQDDSKGISGGQTDFRTDVAIKDFYDYLNSQVKNTKLSENVRNKLEEELNITNS